MRAKASFSSPPFSLVGAALSYPPKKGQPPTHLGCIPKSILLPQYRPQLPTQVAAVAGAWAVVPTLLFWGGGRGDGSVRLRWRGDLLHDSALG